jgi:hypothetical protein
MNQHSITALAAFKELYGSRNSIYASHPIVEMASQQIMRSVMMEIMLAMMDALRIALWKKHTHALSIFT